MSDKLLSSDFVLYILIFLAVTTFVATLEYKRVRFWYRQRTKKGLQRRDVNYETLGGLRVKCWIVSVASLVMIYLLPQYHDRIFTAPEYAWFVVVYLGVFGTAVYGFIKNAAKIKMLFRER